MHVFETAGEDLVTTESGPIDPKILAVLRATFEEACDTLAPHRRTQEIRSDLAVRILALARRGGLNRAQLRSFALREAASPSLGRRKDR